MDPFDLVLLAARNDLEGQAGLEYSVSRCDGATLSAALAQSATHRCTATLADAIRYSPAADVHSRAMATELYYMLRTRHIQFSGEYRRLIAAFQELDADIVVLKGALLDPLLYAAGRPRLYNDLDILVRNGRSRSVAEGVLAHVGYAQAEFDMEAWTLTPFDASRSAGYDAELQHAPEFSRIDGVTGNAHRVDLHTRLSTVFDHIEVAVDQLETRLYETAAGPMRGLAPDDMFAHLAYHAWWDTQSIANIAKGRDLRLYQFTDMHLMLADGMVTPVSVVERSRRIGGEQVVNWALAIIGHLWRPELLEGGVVDEVGAVDFDAMVADRWVQRSTATPIARWQEPAWVRVRDANRADKIMRSFFSDYIDRHTKQGHILTWARTGVE